MTPDGSCDKGQELMMRVQLGDESAFESLVEIYKQSIIQTAFRYIGDASLAEDLAQEVFLRVYRARATYKPLAAFKTWVFRILYNLVVNEVHARRKRAACSLESLRGNDRSEFFISDDRAVTPVEVMEEKELRRKVRETVFNLPENQRMALVLNKYEDQSYQQIAEVMNLSLEAVKSMLFRARENVRNKLVGYLKVEASDEV